MTAKTERPRPKPTTAAEHDQWARYYLALSVDITEWACTGPLGVRWEQWQADNLRSAQHHLTCARTLHALEEMHR